MVVAVEMEHRSFYGMEWVITSIFINLNYKNKYLTWYKNILGDSCCLPFSMGAIQHLVEAYTNGTYVKSLMIGGNIVLDYESGFFIHPDKQVEYVCKALANDKKLRNGYNAIGFSQGGQFL